MRLAKKEKHAGKATKGGFFVDTMGQMSAEDLAMMKETEQLEALQDEGDEGGAVNLEGLEEDSELSGLEDQGPGPPRPSSPPQPWPLTNWAHPLSPPCYRRGTLLPSTASLLTPTFIRGRGGGGSDENSDSDSEEVALKGKRSRKAAPPSGRKTRKKA